MEQKTKTKQGHKLAAISRAIIQRTLYPCSYKIRSYGAVSLPLHFRFLLEGVVDISFKRRGIFGQVCSFTDTVPNDTSRSGPQEDEVANQVMKASRRGIEGHTTETMMQEYLNHKENC